MVTDWRKEEIIDWSKPIETLEGKKLSYVGPFVDGKVVDILTERSGTSENLLGCSCKDESACGIARCCNVKGKCT